MIDHIDDRLRGSEAAPSSAATARESGGVESSCTCKGAAGAAVAAGVACPSSAHRVASVVGTAGGSRAAMGHDPGSLTSTTVVVAPVSGGGASRNPFRSLEAEICFRLLSRGDLLDRVGVSGIVIGQIRFDELRHLPVGGSRRVNRVHAPQRGG